MSATPFREQIAAVQRAIEAYDWQVPQAADRFRKHYLSRNKGVIPQLFAELPTLSPACRKHIGTQLNQLKGFALKAWQKAATSPPPPKEVEGADKWSLLDPTLPPPQQRGGLHILTHLSQEIMEICASMGFTLSQGPEIEDEWHNFTALGIPQDHPARDMQDTFFIDQERGILLRTQTSTIQVRTLQAVSKPPVRTISIGRNFRNETISARAHCTFHQIEGLYVDHDVSFVMLKATLCHLLQALFGKTVKLRLRASYFPFTEPSVEVDITCLLCKGNGCPVCKQSGWVELGGAGMVDPHVLTNSKLDPERYQGFAFGMGLERIAMLRYHIGDLRMFTENDLRFLQQFAIH